jgi:uncharacterized protein YjbI with pentapeptide repeats
VRYHYGRTNFPSAPSNIEARPMVDPERAPVRPRVFAPGGGETLLEVEVLRLAESGSRRVLFILGAPGSGKTTALRHLSDVLPPGLVTLLDAPSLSCCVKAFMAKPKRFLVCTLAAENPEQGAAIIKNAYRLVPWGTDDLIEYLLTAHRPACASVMARVKNADNSFLGGNPELWRPVLDRLAADPALPDPRRALHRYLEEHLTDTDLLERARSACLNAAAKRGADLLTAMAGLARPGFAESLTRILRHAAVQNLLAAERVATDLHGSSDCDYLAERLPRELIQGAATLIASDEEAMAHLRRLLAGPPWSHAMSASLWHATGTGWEEGSQGLLALAGAYLEGVRWPKARLIKANLSGADFSDADLNEADLSHAGAGRIDLRCAQLRRAWAKHLQAPEADLSHADLTEVWAESARFDGADLTGANLEDAMLKNASLQGADLSRASFWNANLSEADLRNTSLRDATFAEAEMSGANLSGLCLREANWEEAGFHRANLNGSDLEGMTLRQAFFPGANLEGALLTGSTMRKANFRNANLRGAKLAEIDWEGACLANADLTGATFHMGSTRSGLVGSPIACEGSRTGFYTDEYDEQTYKAPEEIRKANLCGADLRGARLENVDFYLVDLRGALFDPDQEHHLRQSGAILGARAS